MSIGEVRIVSDNIFQWYIADITSLYKGNAHFSKQLLCQGIKWRFILVVNEDQSIWFGIRPNDRRQSLDLFTDNFAVTITNGYQEREKSFRGLRFDMDYQPEEGWHVEINKYSVSAIANKGDIIIEWSVIQDIDSTDVNRWSDLKQLFLSPDSKNLTLFLKGQKFEAHKETLIARSSLFECLLTPPLLDEDADSVNLDVDSSDPETFEDFLMYLHSPSAEIINTGNAVSLYKTADIFDVRKLMKECAQFMIQELSMDTFFDFAALAWDHRVYLLAELCIALFKKHTAAISETDGWHSFESKYRKFAYKMKIFTGIEINLPDEYSN